MKKLLFAVFACLLFSMSFASAAPAYTNLNGDEVFSLHGTIQSIEGRDVTVSSGKSTVQLHVGWQTTIAAGRSGRIVEFNLLAVGDELTAYYSPVMTRSIPPQSVAYALIMRPTEKSAKYFRADKIEACENGIRVLESNNVMVVTIPKEICSSLEQVQHGTVFLAWYVIGAMSMPGQSTALRVKLLN